MSVMPRDSLQSRFGLDPKNRVANSDPFEELEVVVEGNSVEFRAIHENSTAQLIILWCSAFVFMLFVVSVVPLMKLTAAGNALAVVIGLVVLAAVAMFSQARLQSTTVRLTPAGLYIEQGNMLDRELVELTWNQLEAVELEPVDPKSEKKGMHLEIKLKEGEPVTLLPGASVGDLNGLRQALLKARRGDPDQPV